MIWKKPHISVIYEALTAIADGRMEIRGNRGQCFSLTSDKFYDIVFDPVVGSIMSNDNTSYYKQSFSYPMVAYLMLAGEVPYEEKLLEYLKDVCWEDINKHFKNDYDKSLKAVWGELKSEGTDVNFVRSETQKIYDFVCAMQLKTLGEIQRPVKGY